MIYRFNQPELAGEHAKLVVEVHQLQRVVETVESPEFEKIEDEVKKSLNAPGKIKELANSENWMERFALAELLKITPDMSEESLKEAKAAVEKLKHDPEWAVRFALAVRRDIEPNFFKEVIAEELKKDKDWRVVMGLLSNDNTPKEIISWIKENRKDVLEKMAILEKMKAQTYK